MKRVALVTPPYHSGVVETAGSWPNAAFVYIAGALRAAGHDPVIYDAMTMGHDLDDIAGELERIRPDVVLTSCYTPSYPAGIRMLRVAKECLPGVVTGVGGVHAHFMWNEVLTRDGDVVDFVLRGEGEITAAELCDCLDSAGDLSTVSGIAYAHDGRPFATRSRALLRDLDVLPTAWDLVDWDIYRFYPLPQTRLAVVSTSRGCDQACTFCSQQVFWQRQWRARSAEHVVGELEMLRDEFGVGVVMFADETPTLDPVRWHRILDLLIERDVGAHILIETRVDDVLRDEALMHRYRAAGVEHVYVGVERTDQATLDLFRKDTQVEMGKRAIDLLNGHDIISETSMILGLPTDTPETIRSTMDLALHYNPDLAFFLTIAPWPYADIYDELQPHVVSDDYEDYNFVAPVVKPEVMTVDELMRMVIDCYRTFYTAKLELVPTMPKSKRDYFMITMKLLMENSYLKQFLGGLGTMPDEVDRLLKTWL